MRMRVTMAAINGTLVVYIAIAVLLAAVLTLLKYAKNKRSDQLNVVKLTAIQQHMRNTRNTRCENKSLENRRQLQRSDYENEPGVHTVKMATTKIVKEPIIGQLEDNTIVSGIVAEDDAFTLVLTNVHLWSGVQHKQLQYLKLSKKDFSLIRHDTPLATITKKVIDYEPRATIVSMLEAIH